MHRTLDQLCMVFVTKMIQKVSTRIQHSTGVGNILTSQVSASVSGGWLKDGIPGANIDTRDDTRTTNEATHQVTDNGTVQVGQHHHIKLPGIGHKLHATVVNNHRLMLNVWIIFGNLFAHFKKHSISHLHNISFMDKSH